VGLVRAPGDAGSICHLRGEGRGGPATALGITYACHVFSCPTIVAMPPPRAAREPFSRFINTTNNN